MSKDLILSLVVRKFNDSEMLMDEIEKLLGYVPKSIQDSELNGILTLIEELQSEFDGDLKEEIFKTTI